jgi:Mrp family chromosome partitioning ATPase
VTQTSTGTSVEPSRFEPTVFGAMRRYFALVIAVAVAVTVIAVGYTVKQPKIYRASAAVTVPLPLTLQGQNASPGQYLDSQVLLMESQSVAGQAVGIANDQLGSKTLTSKDFSAYGGSLVVSPPTTATAGNYGASIIGASFTGPTAEIAQVGLASMLQAYNAARTAAVVTESSAATTSLNQAINMINGLLTQVNKQLTSPDPTQSFGGQSQANLQRERRLLSDQLNNLQTALTQATANAQAAEAQQATMAIQPATLINHKWTRAAAIGFLIGILLGGALAYLLASRRRRITDPRHPEVLYDAPILGEIPPFGAGQKWWSNGTSTAAEALPMTAHPGSAVAEAFRFAAGAIERVRVVRGPQVAMAFVSAVGGPGKSAVVANLALALAEGGTRVLVVDADNGLAARLLPGIAGEAGLEHVLAGQRALDDCAEASPLNSAMAVLRSGRLTTGRMTGTARLQAAAKMLAEAKASYDIVLIDTPALLRVADATEIVGAADAAVIVISPEEPIRDHRAMAERLRLAEAEVAGYIYLRASMPSALSLGGAALFDRPRSASQSSPNVRVLEDSDDTAATATSQPLQE